MKRKQQQEEEGRRDMKEESWVSAMSRASSESDNEADGAFELL